MNEGASGYKCIGQENWPLPLKILIIEDVAEDIELIVLTLEAASLSFTYDTASTAARCQDLLGNQAYDIVLSDYRLPSCNGLEIFKLLEESAQDIPFILITGSLGEEAAVECIKAGMSDYVLKDRLSRLPAVLERALQEFALRRQQKAALAKIERQAWQEANVNRIVQAMRETLVLEAVLQATANQLHEALQVSRCSIFQPPPQPNSPPTITYTSRATAGHERLLGMSCDLYDCLQEALAEDRPIVIHDIDYSLPRQVQDAARTCGILSLILMPLTYQRSYLGGICLQQCDRKRRWSDEEIALVNAIATQCALAIHQAKLYQQTQTELAERQKIEAQLRHDAFHDALTGLPNRALLMSRLEHALQLARRRASGHHPTASYQFAVLFLDLDRFKAINDSLGHNVGDQLLKIVARRLQSSLREGDTVARLGGDEFVILLEDIPDISDVIQVAGRIHEKLKGPVLLDGQEVFISTSIGIALSSASYTEPSQLLRDADTAMYRAKRGCRGSYEVFDASMHAHALRQLQLESDLQRAIEWQELKVHYQPIISSDSQCIEEFEALARWQHPQQGMISPGEFIPVAQEAGSIAAIDLWVLQEACRQLCVWLQEFPLLPSLTVSVNLSGKDTILPPP